MKRIVQCLLLIAAASLATDCLALPTLRTVALTGQPAPGVPGGAVFEDVFTDGPDFYTEPQIDDHGRVAFSATFPSQWPDFLWGYWSEGTGSLELVTGNTLPPVGAPPTTEEFSMFAYPVLDRGGNSYFWGTTSGPGLNPSNFIGVWAGKAGSLTHVLQGGWQAPGLPAGVLFQYGTSSPFTAVSASGAIAIHGYLQGPSVDSTNVEALWTGMPESLELLARGGDQAPGTIPGHSFVVLDPNIKINAAGDTAFIASVTNPAGNPIWKDGIWSHRSGATSLVALSGDQAPGTDAGIVFGGFAFETEISISSQAAFAAYLSGPGVTPANRDGVWRETASGLELVARSGSPAPGTAAGTVFGELLYNGVGFDAEGNVIFRGQLVGTGTSAVNNSGVWRATSDSVELVIREGDQAPGTLPGTVFADAPFVATNSLGQMAFAGLLRGSDVNTGTNMGIWASDLSGQLQLIVRKGGLLEVAPGELRTIVDLNMLPTMGYDEAYRALNNKGQLTFRATFSDGTSGVFVSNLVAVPEPGAAMLAVLSLVIWASRRAG